MAALTLEVPNGGKTAEAGAMEGKEGAELSSGLATDSAVLDDRNAPGLVVTVDVEGATYDIRVGKGYQTVRWLALAAAQRLQRAEVSRRRSDKGFIGERKPVNVEDAEGNRVPPQTRLVDLTHIVPKPPARSAAEVAEGKDGELNIEQRRLVRLKVTLGPRLVDRDAHVTETGELAQSTWSAMAYNFSERGRQRTQAKLDAEEALRELQRKEDEERKKREEDERYAKMTKFLVIDVDDPEAMSAALEADWTYVRVEEVTHDEDEIMKIKKILLKRYVAITDVFQYYSGGSVSGSLDSMNLNEWKSALSALPHGLYQFQHELSDITRIFQESTAARDADDDANSLSRFEFMEALLRFAVYKWGGQRRPGMGDPLSPSAALNRLIEDYVLPVAAKIGASDVRELLASRPMQELYNKVLPALKKVFTKYAAADTREFVGSNAPHRDDSSLNFAEFCTVLLDAGLLNDVRHPAKNSAESLTVTEARQCFSSVQRDAIGQFSPRVADAAEKEAEEMGKAPGEKDEDATQELSFSEFYEALARVAGEKWEGSKIEMTLEEKARRAIHMVVSLVADDDDKRGSTRGSARSSAAGGAGGPAGSESMAGKSGLV